MASLVAPYLIPFFLRLARRHYPDALWEGAGREHRIALTFDDGPSRFTSELLDALREEQVPATFFVLGNRVERRPDVLRRAVAEGHLVAIHGYDHCSPKKMSGSELSGSLQRTRQIIEETLGPQKCPACWCYRPPYGHLNRAIVRGVKTLGLRLVMLGILPGEHLLYPSGWRELPAITADRVTRAAGPGAIICLHDGEAAGEADGVYDNPDIASTALAVIHELKKLGYAFTTVEKFMSEEADEAR